MPSYSATVNGKTYDFEASDPAAAEKIAKGAGGSLNAPDDVGKPLAKDVGALLGPDDPARARVEGQMAGRQSGTASALAAGAAAGASRNWNDEVSAAGAASGAPRWLSTIPGAGLVSAGIGAGRMAFGDEGARRSYAKELAGIRGTYEGMKEAHPYATTIGELGGGFIGPKGSNMWSGAVVNAADAGLAGVGAGEDAASRGVGGAAGAGIGGVLGLAVPMATGLVKKGVEGVRGLIGDAASYIEKNAVNTVANAMRHDLQRMDPAQRQQWLQRQILAGRTGQDMDMVIADFGDAETRNLFRKATNISSDAQGQGERLVGERYQGQQDRFREWWDKATGKPNAFARNEQLQDAARKANQPAYDKAYNAPSAASVWSPDLETLTTSDTVRKAIRDATKTSSDYAAAAGQRQAPRNPFVEDAATGTLKLKPGETPTLQFWDHVQRNLRAAEEAAPRGGEEARRIQALRRELNNQLDAHVPEFGQARAGAAAAFGSQDALEAGTKFLDNPTKSSAEARAALAKLNPAERELFENGLIDSVRQKVKGITDSRDVSKLFQSPEIKERLIVGLGPSRAAELQGFLEVERGMDKLRGALSNSNTTRQLIQSGAVGAGVLGSAGAGGATYSDMDLKSTTTLATIVGGALGVGRGKLNQALMTRVGQLLMSNDPADVTAVQQAIARNPTLRTAFNGMIQRVEAVIGQQGGGFVADQQQGAQ